MLNRLAVKLGVPTEIDGVELSDMQVRRLIDIVDKMENDAKHPRWFSVDFAVRLFRKMYDLESGSWVPKRMIVLDSHGGVKVRNKSWLSEIRNAR